MAGANQSGSDGLADRECLAWPDGCDGAVHWQTDGAKRCLQHQRLYERTSRRSRLVSLTVAALIVVVGAVVVNLLIRPEQGPSQARAWEVCHEHTSANLDLQAGTRFAELPPNPSDRVKLSLGSDVYFVFSFFELADGSRREFRCTVRYLGHDEWEVADLTVGP